MSFLMMIVKIALSSIRLWRPSEDAAIARSRVNGCCSSFFSLLSPTGQVAAGHASAPLLFDFCLCESMSSQLTCVTQRTPPPRSGGGLHAADPAGGPLRLHVHRTAHPEVPRPSARPHPPDPHLLTPHPVQWWQWGGPEGHLAPKQSCWWWTLRGPSTTQPSLSLANSSQPSSLSHWSGRQYGETASFPVRTTPPPQGSI